MNGKCPYCKLPVDVFDAVWDAKKRRYYHSDCIETTLVVRLDVLEKKIKQETLTMEEAREYSELKLELEGYRDIEKRLAGKDAKLLEAAFASKTPVFSKKDPRYTDVGVVSRRLRSTTAIVEVPKE